tara:strand:- start:102 stop:1094 length:993 start_codon:yes stop_codon:yes gene_type:complete
MIIKYYELKKNLEKDINIFLFYGPNTDLIEEIIKETKTSYSENIYNYNESEILSDKNTFIVNLFNKSFFESEKLIIINHISEKILEVIKDIIEKKDNSFKIILKTGILEKKSKLRNFFEKEDKLIITPFYEDNHQTLHNLAQNFFKENKIKISTQNINFILEKTKGSRLSLKNELKKIENFSHSKSLVEFKDIIKLINPAENYQISELTDQCLAKNRNKTINILNENKSSIEEDILILKSFLYKLKRLKILKIKIEEEKNQDQVISSYRPPIFWKDKDLIKKQLKIWSLNEIKLLIKKINTLELTIKKNSQLSNQIINNFIFERLDISNS